MKHLCPCPVRIVAPVYALKRFPQSFRGMLVMENNPFCNRAGLWRPRHVLMHLSLAVAKESNFQVHNKQESKEQCPLAENPLMPALKVTAMVDQTMGRSEYIAMSACKDDTPHARPNADSRPGIPGDIQSQACTAPNVSPNCLCESLNSNTDA